MAVENLTTYTEVDPNSRITKTATRSSYAGLTQNEDAYIYKDKGVGHFNGDFEHLIDVYLDASDEFGIVVVWGLANLVDDLGGIALASGDELSVYFFYNGADRILRLRELVGGISYITNYIVSLDTPYYLKIKRDESIGTYGRLYCYVYSDSARTNLLETLQLDLHEKEDFRYIYATQSYNGGMAYAQTGYCENLDLQEIVVPTVTTNDASVPGETTYRTGGNITNTGGENCNRRGVHYGKTGSYGSDSYETGSFGTGNYNRDLTGLDRGTLYYFRAYAVNSAGTGYGSQKTLLTLPAKPSNFNAVDGDECIDLSWTKGDGAQKTYIRGKVGSYPTDKADGVLIYNDTGVSFKHESLDSEDTWYYRAWSYVADGGLEQYSSDYAQDYARCWIYTEWQNTLVTDDEYYEDLTELDPGTEYEFQTQAKNDAGESAWSESAYFETALVITPSFIQAIASVVAPTVIKGSVSTTPSHVASIAGVIQPTVKQGNIIYAPTPIDAISKAVSPSVLYGAITPSPVSAIASGVNPIVVLTSISITPTSIEAIGQVVAPIVSTGGIIYVTPTPLDAIGGRVNPTVILGSISLTPSTLSAIAQVALGNVKQGNIIFSPAFIKALGKAVSPTVIQGSITLEPESIKAIARGENPEVILGSMTITAESVKALAGVIAPTVLETWVGRKLRIKIVTSQYRNLDIITSQKRNIDIVTAQKRKIKVLTSGS